MTCDAKKNGAFSWNELMTTDVKGAMAFYGALFGWEFENNDSAGMPYVIAKSGGDMVAGLMAKPPTVPDFVPPYWGAYVTVANVDQSAEKTVSLGGKILFPPTDIPTVGRFCVIQDPQGAVVSIISYAG